MVHLGLRAHTLDPTISRQDQPGQQEVLTRVLPRQLQATLTQVQVVNLTHSAPTAHPLELHKVLTQVPDSQVQALLEARTQVLPRQQRAAVPTRARHQTFLPTQENNSIKRVMLYVACQPSHN